jgi:phospholipid/cholesterol/gamma-HCH transport system substrate-binding protein
METRANNALIGLFTLVVIAAAFAFVYWFARAADNGAVQTYRVVFNGAVTGLSVGSSVLFNGIRVGEVKSLDIKPDNPSTVVGRITVKEGTPIKVDTRARLEFQGLTGSAYVQLAGGSAQSPALATTANDPEPIIFAERSEFQNLVDGAREVVSQASQTLARVDQWMATNQNDLTRTVTNVADFTQALSENSKNVSDFLAATGDAARSIETLSNNLNAMTDELDALLKAVDPKLVSDTVSSVNSTARRLDEIAKAVNVDSVNATLANVEAFSKTLAEAQEPLAAFAKDAAALTARLGEMAPKLEAGLDGFNKITAAVDPAAVSRAIDNIDKVTTTLGANAGEIDGFVKDARALAANLSAMTPKLEAAFASIEKVTASLDGEKIDRVVTNVDKFAATLGDNSTTIDAFIKDAGEIGQKLNASADRIDGVLKGIEDMTSSPEGKGMFAEFTATARAIRELAEKLDGRTAEITRSITEFTGAGLREYRQLAIDGQRTLQTVDRALRGLERDPQQVIFGPRSALPEFKGQ